MTIMSEKTGKEYGSVEACLADEKLYDERLAAEEAKKKAAMNERKARAEEVENAYKDILKAEKAYKEKLDEFIKDYGSFHMTVHSGEDNPFDLWNWFRDFWEVSI